MLVARTTHLKAGLVWRNGVPHSDQATMTEHYVRHGNMLTVTMILEDPIYWEEPFIRSASFELDSGTRVLPEPCEPQVEIPRAAGEVPHYLPGANPYLHGVRRSCTTCRSRPRAAGRPRRIRSTARRCAPPTRRPRSARSTAAVDRDRRRRTTIRPPVEWIRPPPSALRAESIQNSEFRIQNSETSVGTAVAASTPKGQIESSVQGELRWA